MVQHAVYAVSATLTETECSSVTQKCHLGHMPFVTRRPREAQLVVKFTFGNADNKDELSFLGSV
jgi:hypothetical protein